jgi:hypothetical protein
MNISKDTAKRMLQNIEAQLQSLAQEQQSLNNNKGGSPQYCWGGRVKMATLGQVPDWQRNLKSPGYTQRPGSWQNGIQGFGNDPYNMFQNIPQLSQVPGAFQPMNTSGLSGGIGNSNIRPTAVTDPNLLKTLSGTNTLPDLSAKLNTNTLAKSNMGIGPKPQGDQFNWQEWMPAAFNLGAGLMSGRAQHLNPEQFQDPYEQQSLSMMPDQFRIDDMLNSNKGAYANFTRNINNVGNSRGELMSNYGAGMNQYNQANTQAYALKNNQENAMRTNKAQMFNEQGVRRAGVNLNVQNMNDQNSAGARTNRMSYLSQVPTSIQQNYLINKQMANQKESQDAWVRAMSRMPFWTQGSNSWTGLENYVYGNKGH